MQSYARTFTTLGAIYSIWFNPKVDTLLIDAGFLHPNGDQNIGNVLNSITTDNLKKVEYLCIRADFLENIYANFLSTQNGAR